MPPKGSSGRSPKKSTRKSPRQRTPAFVPDVHPERLEDGDEEEDGQSEDDAEPEGGASVAEGSHAGALALSKIREALAGLSQEDLQLLVKGTSTSRPLQVEDKAAASAALDQAVRNHLYDTLDDSTRNLYLSVASDPTTVQEGVWTRIFQALDRLHQNYCPTFQSIRIIRCLIGVPRRLRPIRSLLSARARRKIPQMMFSSRFRRSLWRSSCDSCFRHSK